MLISSPPCFSFSRIFPKIMTLLSTLTRTFLSHTTSRWFQRLWECPIIIKNQPCVVLRFSLTIRMDSTQIRTWVAPRLKNMRKGYGSHQRFIRNIAILVNCQKVLGITINLMRVTMQWFVWIYLRNSKHVGPEIDMGHLLFILKRSHIKIGRLAYGGAK